MKKILLSTTLLVATAGVAAAEVVVSGAGRFGLVYNETPVDGENETTISMRLRFNIDAKKETDAGVTFGGRIRMQYEGAVSGSDGGSDEAAGLSAAYVYAEYEGMRLEVGNSNTAFDSAALMYNSEIGYLGRSFGNPGGNYFSFSSGAVARDYMGIYFAYSVGDFTGQVSYVDPDQTDELVFGNTEEELSVAASYVFGAFTVSGAYVQNGGGIDGNDQAFLGAAYAVNDVANIGLLYFDNGENADESDNGETFTLYGNYTFDAITVRGYIADNSEADDVALGLGADYDLGGATLSGSIQGSGNDDTTADLGVTFSF